MISPRAPLEISKRNPLVIFPKATNQRYFQKLLQRFPLNFLFLKYFRYFPEIPLKKPQVLQRILTDFIQKLLEGFPEII